MIVIAILVRRTRRGLPATPCEPMISSLRQVQIRLSIPLINPLFFLLTQKLRIIDQRINLWPRDILAESRTTVGEILILSL